MYKRPHTAVCIIPYIPARCHATSTPGPPPSKTPATLHHHPPSGTSSLFPPSPVPPTLQPVTPVEASRTGTDLLLLPRLPVSLLPRRRLAGRPLEAWRKTSLLSSRARAAPGLRPLPRSPRTTKKQKDKKKLTCMYGSFMFFMRHFYF